MQIKFLKNNTLGLSLVTASTLFVGTTQAASLPEPKSGHDPVPTAPRLSVPADGITTQAGVGGSQSYARTGVMELGGSIDFSSTTDYNSFSARPSVGYFFMDNWEISGIMAWHQAKVENVNQASFALLVEPSIHAPFTDTMFGFVGVGVGISAAKGSGAGAALAPRLGLNILVGRSGILSPEINMQYSSNRTVATSQGTLLAVRTSFGFGAGFTVML